MFMWGKNTRVKCIDSQLVRRRPVSSTPKVHFYVKLFKLLMRHALTSSSSYVSLDSNIEAWWIAPAASGSHLSISQHH